MASKLKILVDHTCDVFCDFNLMGEATPNNLFFLNLRKGKYILEFKVKGEIKESYVYNESIDYIMESNDEDDLIKINLLNHISIKPISIKRFTNLCSYRGFSDENNGERNYSNVYLKCEESEISNMELSYFKGINKIDLTFIARIVRDYSCWDLDEIYQQEIEMLISLDIDNNDQTVLYDGNWLSELGLIIYLNDNIYIYEIDKHTQKGWRSCKTYSRFGDIYAPYKETVFFVKDRKLGLFDLNQKQILINPLYDEIYNQADCRGEIRNTLYYKKDKTFIVKNNNLTNKIDFNGNLLAPNGYKIIFSCFLGHVVKKDDKWGVSTSEGIKKEWFDDIYIYDRYIKCDTHHDVDDYDMEILFCRKGDKYGFWNCVGEFSGIIYDGFITSRLDGHIGDDYIFTKRENKIGLINNRGIVFVDCLYDEIYFEFFYEASIYIFDIFPSFVYYTMTNKKTESYLKWEKEMIEKGKLKTDYSFEEAKKLIYIPQFIVRNGDLYGVVQLDNKEILPVLYTKQEAEYYVQDEAIEWSNKFL